MKNVKYFIPLFALILLIPPSLAHVELTGVDEEKTYNENPHMPSDITDPITGDITGPIDNTLLDITTLESYKLHPEITKEMLEVLPGEKALTVDFGIAYDELNLIDFGIKDHIREEHVEFLEDLKITLFGKSGDALQVGLAPYHEDKLPEIKQRLESMYPNVELDVSIAEFWYVDV